MGAFLAALALALTILGGAIAFLHSSKAPRSESRNIPVSASCFSPTFCVAVDDQGSATIFNGHSWSPRKAVTRAPMTSVSC